MAEEKKLNPFEEAIKAFLDKKAAEDELFAKTYAKPHKSIKECCEWLISEARKMASNNVGIIDDATTYGMAVHYYDEDSIKVTKPAPKAAVVAPRPVEVKKPEPEKPKERQLSIFDFL